MTSCNRVTHSCRCMHPPLRSGCVRIWHLCVTLLQHVTCCIETNIKYNTVELCMCLHVNSVYLCSYSGLFHEGSSTKMMLLFCEDHRNNVLQRLKFVFMIFKSQNNCICGTPTSTQPILRLPLCKMVSIQHSKI